MARWPERAPRLLVSLARIHHQMARPSRRPEALVYAWAASGWGVGLSCRLLRGAAMAWRDVLQAAAGVVSGLPVTGGPGGVGTPQLLVRERECWLLAAVLLCAPA